MKLITKPQSYQDFIMVYRSVSGWKAVYVWWSPEGYHEPYMTGLGGYSERHQAENEAKDWAECEGIAYLDNPAVVL